MRTLHTILLIFFALGSAFAQSDNDLSQQRPSAMMFSFDAGFASTLDTYLSPIRYKGEQMRLGFEHRRNMALDPEKWMMISEAAIDYNHTKNPAKNHTMHQLSIDGQWNMLRKYNPFPTTPLQFWVGGGTELRGGVIYNPINDNNPCSAKIHWSLNFAAGVAFSTHIGSAPVTVFYRAELPSLGIFFSPEYDESFFEIYKGNTKGLVRFGWWGNRFDLVNLVAADFTLGKTVLRVGSRGRIESSWVRHLNTQIFTHSLVIGLGGKWLQVK